MNNNPQRQGQRCVNKKRPGEDARSTDGSSDDNLRQRHQKFGEENQDTLLTPSPVAQPRQGHAAERERIKRHASIKQERKIKPSTISSSEP